jgi:VRR-NUC domain
VSDPLASLRKRKGKDIQTAILTYLDTVPSVVAWKNGTAGFHATYKGRERFVKIGKRGVADIIGWQRVGCAHPGCLAGQDGKPPTARFLAIEVKRPGETLTAAQQHFLDLVRRDGGIALVATCVEDVARALAERDAARQERDRYLKERDQSWEETAGAMARAEEAEAMVRLQRDAAEELRQRAQQAEQERDRLREQLNDYHRVDASRVPPPEASQLSAVSPLQTLG